MLILALLMLRQNRRRAAWLIVLPIAIFHLITFYIPGRERDLFGLMMMIIACSIASWMLLTSSAPAKFVPWFVRAVLALVLTVAVSIGSYFGAGQTREAGLIALYPAIGFAALIVAILIAGRQNRRKPTMPRLMIWSGVYMFVVFLAAMFAMILGIAIFDDGLRRNLYQILPQIFKVGAIMGLILNGLFQPFMILARVSPFWRERMRRIFRIPDEPAPKQEPEPVPVESIKTHLEL